VGIDQGDEVVHRPERVRDAGRECRAASQGPVLRIPNA
jgi:hypothetical protein